jgi:hypothetical protein
MKGQNQDLKAQLAEAIEIIINNVAPAEYQATLEHKNLQLLLLPSQGICEGIDTDGK